MNLELKFGKGLKCEKQYIKEKGEELVEKKGFQWWTPQQTDVSVKNHLRVSFPFKGLLKNTIPWSKETRARSVVPGYFKGFFHVSVHLRGQLVTFPAFSMERSRKTSKIVIYWGKSMQKRKQEGHFTKHRVLQTYCSEVMIGIIINLLLFFCVIFVLTEKQLFADYITFECFNDLVQSDFKASRQKPGNPKSAAVAERMILLGNSCYSKNFLDCNHRSVIEYLSNEKHIQQTTTNCSVG